MKKNILLIIFCLILFNSARISQADIGGGFNCFNPSSYSYNYDTDPQGGKALCKANCASGLYDLVDDGSGLGNIAYIACKDKLAANGPCTENRNCVSGSCVSLKCASGNSGTDLGTGQYCGTSETECQPKCTSGLSELHVDVPGQTDFYCTDQKANGEPCTENKNCRTNICDLSNGTPGKCAINSALTPGWGSTAPGTGSPGTGSTVPAKTASGGIVNFTNPLTFTNVEDLLTNILVVIQRIIVTLALVFIAIGAVMILVSAGSPAMVERGKKAITMALVGLAVGIAAPSILKELAGVLGWGSTTNATVNAAPKLSTIALNVLNFLLGIVGVLALIMLIIGAIMYLTSAGNEDRIDRGKKIFVNALIGVVIVMASLVIVQQIALFFSA